MRRGASRESSSRHGIWSEIDHLSKYGGFFDVSERVPELGFGFSMTILYEMRDGQSREGQKHGAGFGELKS